MKEIKPLTSLRAFAAFLVFMFHYAYVYTPDNRGVTGFAGEWVPLMKVWMQGPVGVSIFFVLSGFLITRIYYDAFAGRTASWRLFFVKRVARIWPLFLAYAAVQHLVLALRGHGPDASWLVTCSMSQGFFADLRYEGLPTAWSLTVEESFYVVAPLLYLLLAKTASMPAGGAAARRWLRLGATLLALTVGAAIVGEALVKSAAGGGWDWRGLFGNRYHMWHATLLGRMPEFAIGIAAAFLHRAGLHERWFAGRRAPAAAAACFVGIGALMALKAGVADLYDTRSQALTYVYAYLIAGATAVLILALSLRGNPIERALSHPLLVYLGKISYGFYLVQITVMLEPMVALTDRLGWARLPVLLVLMNLFCAATYELIEKPARRVIVARWGGRAA